MSFLLNALQRLEWQALPPQHPDLAAWLSDPKDSQTAGEGAASCIPESAQHKLTQASGAGLQGEGPTLFAQLKN